MATSGVKLLGARQSPFMTRVMMALEMKSIDYEVICEFLIIVQYIDDAWTNGPSILPPHPHDRATARFWAAFVDDKLVPLLGQLREAEGEDAKELVFKKLFEAFMWLEEAFINCSKGKAFFGGDSIGYLDIALGSFVGYIRVTEMMNETKLLDETKTPSLAG
ncbi:glutathione transferase [Salvia divinorum]|uniref:Glutathione S-transferase n=1 Tax=Salvia divinorum TaxID=28513 RepID=A0ABD1H3G2_SALDI